MLFSPRLKIDGFVKSGNFSNSKEDTTFHLITFFNFAVFNFGGLDTVFIDQGDGIGNFWRC